MFYVWPSGAFSKRVFPYGMYVGSYLTRTPGTDRCKDGVSVSRLMVPVLLNRKWEELMVATKCSRALVHHVMGQPLTERLCIHGDVQECPTIIICIQVTGCWFHCLGEGGPTSG